VRHGVLVAHLEGDVRGQPFPLIEDGFQGGLVLAVISRTCGRAAPSWRRERLPRRISRALFLVDFRCSGHVLSGGNAIPAAGISKDGLAHAPAEVVDGRRVGLGIGMPYLPSVPQVQMFQVKM